VSLADRLKADLKQALSDRDATRVRVLRTTIAAIEDAEAVEGVNSSEGIIG
jgi:uncharacterized protein YqeY